MAQPVLTIAHCRVKPRSDQIQLHVQGAAVPQGSWCGGAQAGAVLAPKGRTGHTENALMEPPGSGRERTGTGMENGDKELGVPM